MTDKENAWLNLYEYATDAKERLLALMLARRQPIGRAFMRFLRAFYAECRHTALRYGYEKDFRSRPSLEELADFCSERHKISPSAIVLNNAPIFGALPEEIGLLAPTMERIEFCEVESVYSMPLALGKLHKLRSLDFSGTYRIDEVWDLFEGCTALCKLNLSRTRIRKLPPSLLLLPKLEWLNISYTNIPAEEAQEYKKDILRRLPQAQVFI